jgi:phosphocarrier protein HPr
VTQGASGKFTILNARGMHARAASKLVQLAAQFPCTIELVGPEGEPVNGKSVMSVLLLCGIKGTVVEVRATGPQAEQAVEAIGTLIDNRFGEAE